MTFDLLCILLILGVSAVGLWAGMLVCGVIDRRQEEREAILRDRKG